MGRLSLPSFRCHLILLSYISLERIIYLNIFLRKLFCIFILPLGIKNRYLTFKAESAAFKNIKHSDIKYEQKIQKITRAPTLTIMKLKMK